MMEDAARARKWMLWAAPAMALSGLSRRAGGAAAALGLWMALGLLLSGGQNRIKLYPKQRRMRVHRLLLGYAFCVFCLAAFEAGGRLLSANSLSPSSRFLLSAGGIGFSLPLGAMLLKRPVKKRISLALSLLFFACSAFLFLIPG